MMTELEELCGEVSEVTLSYMNETWRVALPSGNYWDDGKTWAGCQR